MDLLRELADLLGQVKPPVASKEDIEKSGLEIIKPSSLPGYEKLGKVASNTVERVGSSSDFTDRMLTIHLC